MAQVDPKQLKQAGASPNDVLTWDGSEWAPAAGGGGGSTITGLTTAGLADGDVCYISAANTATRSDATAAVSARTAGVYKGTSGSLSAGGKISAVKFTTDGGSPANGAPVYVALGSADTSTGAGKLTATAPDAASQFVSEVGICLDNSNYAGSKTCVIAWAPKVSFAL